MCIFTSRARSWTFRNHTLLLVIYFLIYESMPSIRDALKLTEGDLGTKKEKVLALSIAIIRYTLLFDQFLKQYRLPLQSYQQV